MTVNTLKRCLVATTVGLTMSWLAIGEAFAYTYTKIADNSNSAFIDFSRYPVINNAGDVVFGANPSLDGGIAGIFTSNGGETTSIVNAITSNVFSLFGNVPVLNDVGTVAFRGNLDIIGSGIYTNSNGTVNTIATSSLARGAFDEPKINNNDTVIFSGYSIISGRAIFMSTGGTTSTIADTAGAFSDFPSGYAINDANSTAFVAKMKVGGYAICVNTNGVTNQLIYTKAPYNPFSFLYNPAINIFGTVAFKGLLKVGGQGVYTTDGLNTITIADSIGPFSFFENPSINDVGKVAFKGVLDNGSLGIFTGVDPVADKVIGTGDTLFGSTVTDVYVSGKSLNNNNQIVFYAKLADGTKGIYRADPDVVPPQAEVDTPVENVSEPEVSTPVEEVQP